MNALVAPASAVPIYFDLQRMTTLCAGLGQAPPVRPSPYAGWEDFCRRATAQPDQCNWRSAVMSFVRWQGARDGLLVEALVKNGARRTFGDAWRQALGRREGVLFAGWVDMRLSAESPLEFSDRSGQRRKAWRLTDDRTRSFNVVLEEPRLLTDQAAARRRLGALEPERAAPILLVGRMDRVRTLTPFLAAVGCA